MAMSESSRGDGDDGSGVAALLSQLPRCSAALRQCFSTAFWLEPRTSSRRPRNMPVATQTVFARG
jgi:hypothetical protein